MSKSSGTNSPTLQLWSVCLICTRSKIILKFFLSPSYTVGPPQRPVRAEASTKEKNNGGNSDGDPPLPIPNREVKPVSADGTAIPSGRVGSRQPSEDDQKWLSSFFL